MLVFCVLPSSRWRDMVQRWVPLFPIYRIWITLTGQQRIQFKHSFWNSFLYLFDICVYFDDFSFKINWWYQLMLFCYADIWVFVNFVEGNELVAIVTFYVYRILKGLGIQIFVTSRCHIPFGLNILGFGSAIKWPRHAVILLVHYPVALLTLL